MDWKTILEDAIDKYTAVNGKKPHCAITSIKTREQIFLGINTLQRINDIMVLYSFEIPNNEILLMNEASFRSYPRCLSYPFVLLEP